ncbi:HigA family addiction module antitoxin [Paracoccus versutus]
MTAQVLAGKPGKGFPANLSKIAVRKVAMLQAARLLDDLRAPKASRLEALKGDRAGQHSIRVNVAHLFHLDPERPCRCRNRGLPLKGTAMTMLQVPVHPGEILKEEFLDEMGISAGKLARHIHVPRTRIERLVKEETAMTVDTAQRLAKALGTSVEFWMNLQLNYDLITNTPDPDVADIQPLAAA